MRKITLLLLAVAFLSCQKEKPIAPTENTEQTTLNVQEYELFGEAFDTDEVLSTEEMKNRFASLEVGDSLEVVFQGNIKEVCQKKGCWMKVDLADEEAFVRFTDYGFFVPKDAADADAVLKGKAFKNETSVEELRHYAQDAGQSEEEIAAIVSPKIEYTFMADGVLLKKVDEILE
ncbi:MAG TPA: DUF4920 domain-containing protein [Moheibacter sp.]|nr:DUF4920 domain-containing protein [Moheibacter sp.]